MKVEDIYGGSVVCKGRKSLCKHVKLERLQ
jgi:hypothetical protein